ncbi:unnamed protein product [Notodromas monacha]|uniref:Latrophilin Cirl n=1 Tax=Notodromas monacha TaxID=399045 RepID=A0A7R9BJZ4_9CRUS|nr:unnamed protein product [Notodromas monacha]CAG0915516.1 unnamed protein product [Notodromas monacha]
MKRNRAALILFATQVLLQTSSAALVCTGKAPRYHNGYACQGTLLNIGCEEGHVINLLRSNFGRFSIQRCNEEGVPTWSTDCMSHRSLRVLHSRCSSKQKCEVFADETLFGDPCPGTRKYLEAHYQCLPVVERANLTTTSTTVVSIEQEMNVTSTTIVSMNSEESVVGGRELMMTQTDAGDQSEYLADDSDAGGDDDDEDLLPIHQLPLRFSNRPPSTVKVGEPCEAKVARNMTWNRTAPGDTALQTCPSGSAPETARWKCFGPAWETVSPDLSKCRSLYLNFALKRLAKDQDLETALNEVKSVTESKVLFGGDLFVIAKLLKETAQKLMGKDVKVVSTEIAKVMGIGSDLLSHDQAQAWDDLPSEFRSRAATEILFALEDNAFVLADGLAEDRTVLVSQENILMSAQKLRPDNFPIVTFPSEEEASFWPEVSALGNSIRIPGRALERKYGSRNGASSAAKVVFFLIAHMERILAPENASEARLGSSVVSASVAVGRHVQLAEPVTIVFKNLWDEQLDRNVTGRACVFWDYINHAWSEEGCGVSVQNSTHTVCKCSHLTHFAVLLTLGDEHTLAQQLGQDWQLRKFADWAASVACYACAAALGVAWALTAACGKDLDWGIWRNMLACVGVGTLVMGLGGIGHGSGGVWCGLLAGTAQYFFLAGFLWTFIQEFDLYMALVELAGLDAKRRMRWYAVCAYGLPLVVVCASAGADPAAYAHQTLGFCWLQFGLLSLLSFAGPVLVLIVATVVVVLMALLLSSRTSASLPRSHTLTRSQPPADRITAADLNTSAVIAQTRKWIAWSAGFATVLTVCWTMALLSVSEGTLSGTTMSWLRISYALAAVGLGLVGVLGVVVLGEKQFGDCQVRCRRWCCGAKKTAGGSAEEQEEAAARRADGGPAGDERRKRGENGMLETRVDHGTEPGMNYYITTLKNFSSTVCPRCPQPYCNMGDQLLLSSTSTSTAALHSSSSSSTHQAAVSALRAQSPGNHTYMELELNTDASRIYAEIEHNGRDHHPHNNLLTEAVSSSGRQQRRSGGVGAAAVAAAAHSRDRSDGSNLSVPSSSSASVSYYSDGRPLLHHPRQGQSLDAGIVRNIQSIPEDRALDTRSMSMGKRLNCGRSGCGPLPVPPMPGDGGSTLMMMTTTSTAAYAMNNLNRGSPDSNIEQPRRASCWQSHYDLHRMSFQETWEKLLGSLIARSIVPHGSGDSLARVIGHLHFLYTLPPHSCHTPYHIASVFEGVSFCTIFISDFTYGIWLSSRNTGHDFKEFGYSTKMFAWILGTLQTTIYLATFFIANKKRISFSADKKNACET